MVRLKNRPVLATLLLGWSLTFCVKSVDATGPIKNAHVEVELIGQHESVQPGQSFVVGLRLSMDKHWHTYWINPGDAGLATKIQWTLPDGFQAGPIQWPHPDRFMLGPFVSFGYEDEVLLPVQIQAPKTIGAERVQLSADVQWLACENSCIQGAAQLKLELPVSEIAPKINKQWAMLFATTQTKLPRQLPTGQIRAFMDGQTIGLSVGELDLSKSEDPQLYFYPATSDTTDYAALQPWDRQGSSVILRLTPSKQLDHPLKQLKGVLVIKSEDRTEALSIDVEVEKGAAVAATTTPSVEQAMGHQPDPSTKDSVHEAVVPRNLTTSMALIYALVGGLLLNLMPCVFPVLSIKILGFVQQAGEDRTKVRRHGLMFAIGVLASFWVLSALLITLRATGQQLGWGFQLQDPLFVAVLTLLMFAIGLNLFGLFEIGTGLSSIAGRPLDRVPSGTYIGSFLNGVLATAVATPCTAPFMGSAVGYALTIPAAASIAVFTALAIGMAFPYVLLSWFPAWLRWLPKPGLWMVSFKQAMAFPMFAAAIWLVCVYAKAFEFPFSLLRLLFSLWALAMAGWILGRWGQLPSSLAVRWRARCIAAIVAMGAVLLTMWSPNTSRLQWLDYSDELITELRLDNRIVFVDFTADWCITCKFYEGTVLASNRVVETFKNHRVALVKADWTRRDEYITQALERLGKGSVPVYVVYSSDPTQPPEVLPDVITSDLVIEALNRAASHRQARLDGVPWQIRDRDHL